MDLVLLTDWNGLPSGRPLFGVQCGQAEIMIARGIAKRFEALEASENSVKPNTNRGDSSNIRASHTRASKKAS